MIREARKEVLRLETKSPHIYETLDYKRLNKKSFIAVFKRHPQRDFDRRTSKRSRLCSINYLIENDSQH